MSSHNDGLNNIGTTNIEFTNELAKYLSVAQKCDIYKDCFHTRVKNIRDALINIAEKGFTATQIGYGPSDYATGLVLNNGTTMSIIYNPLCTEYTNIHDASDSYGQNHVCSNIVFDTNGKAPPNKVGKDIGFVIIINPKNTVVAGGIPDLEDLPTSDWQTASSACLAKGGTWHLPSRAELNSLSYNRFLAGSFDPGVSFWSSTEVDSTRAWAEGLAGGYQSIKNKNTSSNVRCIKR